MFLAYVFLVVFVYCTFGLFTATMVVAGNYFRLKTTPAKEILKIFFVSFLLWPIAWIIMDKEMKEKNEKG